MVSHRSTREIGGGGGNMISAILGMVWGRWELCVHFVLSPENSKWKALPLKQFF